MLYLFILKYFVFVYTLVSCICLYFCILNLFILLYVVFVYTFVFCICLHFCMLYLFTLFVCCICLHFWQTAGTSSFVKSFHRPILTYMFLSDQTIFTMMMMTMMMMMLARIIMMIMTKIMLKKMIVMNTLSTCYYQRSWLMKH